MKLPPIDWNECGPGLVYGAIVAVAVLGTLLVTGVHAGWKRWHG